MLWTTALLLALRASPLLAAPIEPTSVPSDVIVVDAGSPLAVATSIGERLLEELEIPGYVTAREKAPLSIWAKMKRKRLPVEYVMDRLAIRLHVDTHDACYALYDTLVSRFDVIGDQTDDYIRFPKANGYRSIHLVLSLPSGPVEVQIRTHEMHHRAEVGSAAHWRYKLESNGREDESVSVAA